ncbi:MAG: cation:proton antiporter, partial [Microvirga sp.]
PVADLMKTSASDPLALLMPLAITLGKVVAFVALMLVVGRRLIPWVLHYVAHTGSRELFRLSVLAVALGVAYGAALLFGVSFALGAFFAGMMMSESELSHRAASESLPLRDAFAVLFFVSVGMLFDPTIIVREFGPVMATFLIIVVGKSLAALAIVRLFGHPKATILTIAASLAQIGEFSFILAGLGVDLAILPERGRDLILAGAILSILVNPLLFAILDRWLARSEAATTAASDEAARVAADAETRATTALTDHVVLVGHGRVGQFVSAKLRAADIPFLVIEMDDERAADLRKAGIETIAGNAADPEVAASANIRAARCVLVVIPDAFESGQVVDQARKLNPTLPIIARSHSEAESAHLRKFGVDRAILGEQEVARAMVKAIPQVDPASGTRVAQDAAMPPGAEPSGSPG